MNPQRLKLGDDELGSLLREGKSPRPLREPERQRSIERVRLLGWVPAAAGVGLWVKGVAAAVGLAATVVTTKVVIDFAGSPNEHATSPSIKARGASKGRTDFTKETVREPAPSEAATASESHSPEDVPSRVDGVVASAEGDAPNVALPASPRASVAPTPPVARSAEAVRTERSAGTIETAIHTDTATKNERSEEIAPAVEREAKMLSLARDRIRSSPAESLSIVADHERTFPNGQLAEEREVLAVDALMRLGRSREATERARPLKGGIYQERVESILRSVPGH